MKAVFFRHGPALAQGTPGVAEADRPLTPEGRRKTLQAARGLRALDLGITVICTSPLPRALQTAEILAKVLGLPPPEIREALLPDAAPLRLLSELRRLRRETPALVGHEPQLSAAVARATGASIELRKAGMALVEFSRVAPRAEGTLTLLLRPAVLRKLGS
ncbi:MAG: histidine phosphatase family protein [Planctomycetes bacterium]|nr:histidine phosphatase family protein [Planctomycetota bacterium]